MARTRNPQGKPRLREAERNQLEFREYSLDSLLPEGHRARVLWELVGKLDLRAFYDVIEAREHAPGHPAIDPKILLTRWLFVTAEGVGSARQLERLCTRDNAYRWICGGVSTNYHTLADFRVAHGDRLDGLLTRLLAVLMKEELIDLQRVAQKEGHGAGGRRGRSYTAAVPWPSDSRRPPSEPGARPSSLPATCSRCCSACPPSPIPT